MGITLKDLKAIRSDLAKRKPQHLIVDCNRALTTKEIILSLAPQLAKMKSRGFSTNELLNVLQEYKISVKGATLNRYLAEHKENQIQASAHKHESPPPKTHWLQSGTCQAQKNAAENTPAHQSQSQVAEKCSQALENNKRRQTEDTFHQ